MRNPTINTQQVRPVLYVRSWPSLDRMQNRIAPVAGVTGAAAASAWAVGDQAQGDLAAFVAVFATIGTVAITAGPLASILNDARGGRDPRDRDLAPVVAAALAALTAAVWSGLWIQAVALALGAIVITAEATALIDEAQIQLGAEVE